MRLALLICAFQLFSFSAFAPVRSPKDAADPAHLNAQMRTMVLPPAPPGYVAPSTTAVAPVAAPSVVTVVVPSLPVDIGPPIIGTTNICFPVLSQFSNAVILASTDLKTWTPLTNFCGMGERMFFRLMR